MSKFEECMETYRAEFKKLNVKFDDALLTKVAKGCGPSIYNRDASTVAGSDEKELATVKNNFLIKPLEPSKLLKSLEYSNLDFLLRQSIQLAESCPKQVSELS